MYMYSYLPLGANTHVFFWLLLLPWRCMKAAVAHACPFYFISPTHLTASHLAEFFWILPRKRATEAAPAAVMHDSVDSYGLDEERCSENLQTQNSSCCTSARYRRRSWNTVSTCMSWRRGCGVPLHNRMKNIIPRDGCEAQKYATFEDTGSNSRTWWWWWWWWWWFTAFGAMNVPAATTKIMLTD